MSMSIFGFNAFMKRLSKQERTILTQIFYDIVTLEKTRREKQETYFIAEKIKSDFSKFINDFRESGIQNS